ncbi:unnamed protein product [Linum tenue]|uniref:Uncharacterized protein n=1 Tax=Linum tenue TaxID=586396 RepID=A0AAV0KAA5_9ROSI|nr:unnamed protein product [Linum tenue]
MHAGVHRKGTGEVPRQMDMRLMRRSGERRDRENGGKTDKHGRSSEQAHELLQEILVVSDLAFDLGHATDPASEFGLAEVVPSRTEIYSRKPHDEVCGEADEVRELLLDPV